MKRKVHKRKAVTRFQASYDDEIAKAGAKSNAELLRLSADTGSMVRYLRSQKFRDEFPEDTETTAGHIAGLMGRRKARLDVLLARRASARRRYRK